MNFLNMLFSTGWGILSILIIFNGSIFVHELGHFLAARKRGLKVNCFSLFGIGPKLIKWKGKGDVEYCICALPFGAYVSIPQLSGTEKQENLPTASYWDMFVSVLWGPLANILFALFLASILWMVGQPNTASLNTTQIGHVHKTLESVNSDPIEGPGYKAGLKAGDKILKVDGHEVNNFKDITLFIITGSNQTAQGEPSVNLEIERNGKVKKITVLPALIIFNKRTNDQVRRIGIEPKELVKVGRILKDSAANEAGLKAGDIIQSANEEPIYHIERLLEILEAYKNKPIHLKIQRNETEIISVKIQAKYQILTKPSIEIQLAGGTDSILEIIPDYKEKYASNIAKEDHASTLRIFKIQQIPLLRSIKTPLILDSLNGVALKNLLNFNQVWEASKQKNLYKLGLINPKTKKHYQLTLPNESTLRSIPPKGIFIIGIIPTPITELIYRNPISQIQEHISKTFHLLGKLIHPNSDIELKHLSGPVGIGRMIYQVSQIKENGWKILLWFGVLLNVNLAILNLLPIPVLDGGHLFFGSIQALFKNKIPRKIIEGIQGICFILLLGLMFYVLFYDSMRWVGDNEDKQMLNREKARMIDSN